MNMYEQPPRQPIQPQLNQRLTPPQQPLPQLPPQPTVNFKNLIGAIGIIAVLYAGHHIYRAATQYNPFEWLRQVFGSGDVTRLTVLGVILILGTVVLKRFLFRPS